MRFKIITAIAVLIMMMALTLTGCGGSASGGGSADTDSVTVEDLASIKMFTSRDLSGEYDEASATKIKLSDEDVTIDREGVYILCGKLQGQVNIDADDEAKIQIVLDGVEITNDNSAAIYVKSANKVFVTLAEGSENSLKVTGKYEADGDTNVDSVIFSKDDLTINGSGKLAISSAKGHGIVSKDDLVITGGNIDITAGKKGLDAHNSIRIADGQLKIEAGTDGLHSEDEDKGVGFVYIKDGEINIASGDDGIHAYTDLVVEAGSVKISKSCEGLEGNTVIINGGTVDVTSEDDGFNAVSSKSKKSGQQEGQNSEQNSRQNSEAPANDETAWICINGGKIHVDAEGDGLDSNGSLKITSGTTVVEGPSRMGNGSVDVGEGGEAVITGGTFMAASASGMGVNFSENSKQGAILTNCDSATGKIEVKDSDGNVIASMKTDKSFQCVQVSAPDIKKGQTYTISAGGSNQEIKMESLIYGQAAGPGAGPGAGPEGSGAGPEAPPNGERPDSQNSL
ncbi:MAG: carbohydrate-binding domain-containing protein [Bacillota bacterium]|nr:carbohydrate-binding domain-containing protein [Bacillota bacterium]